MLRITGTRTGPWTVQRTCYLRVADGAADSAARLGLAGLFKQLRKQVNSGILPDVLASVASASTGPSTFPGVVSRAIHQAEKESGTVRMAELQRALGSRFSEHRKAFDKKTGNIEDAVATVDKWILQCRDNSGPFGEIHASAKLFDRLQRDIERKSRDKAEIQTRLTETSHKLTAQIARADQMLDDLDRSTDPAPAASFWTRENLNRAAPHALWLLLSFLLVMLFLPTQSWMSQTAAIGGVFLATEGASTVIRRRQRANNPEVEDTPRKREAQSALRRIAPMLSSYFELAEAELLKGREIQLGQEFLDRVGDRMSASRKLSASFENFEREVGAAVAAMNPTIFTEVLPTEIEVGGRRVAETILASRIPDLESAAFCNRVLRAYQAATEEPLSASLLSTSVTTVRENLEAILREEIGPLTLTDVLEAVQELGGGVTLTRYLRILANEAQGVYRTKSSLPTGVSRGWFTLGLPDGFPECLRGLALSALTRPPLIQLSFADELELSWTALDLPNEDSLLHSIGVSAAEQFDAGDLDTLWRFPGGRHSFGAGRRPEPGAA